MTDSIPAPSGLGLETEARATIVDINWCLANRMTVSPSINRLRDWASTIDRLITALSEARRLSASQYAALQAKSISDGIAREAAPREEEREACALLIEHSGVFTHAADRRDVAAASRRHPRQEPVMTQSAVEQAKALTERISTAWRRFGGLERLSRTAEGRKAILESAVAEALTTEQSRVPPDRGQMATADALDGDHTSLADRIIAGRKAAALLRRLAFPAVGDWRDIAIPLRQAEAILNGPAGNWEAGSGVELGEICSAARKRIREALDALHAPPIPEEPKP